MACDCIEKIESRLKSGASGKKFHDASCKNLRIIKGKSGIKLRLAILFEYKKPKRYGSGYESNGYDVPIYATHCPFCGKLYDEEKKING